jgi:hypothetical protein
LNQIGEAKLRNSRGVEVRRSTVNVPISEIEENDQNNVAVIIDVEVITRP